MRLQQQRIVRGTKGSRILGLGGELFDCKACDKSGPNDGEEEKQRKNCMKNGRPSGEWPERPYLIDFTNIARRDHCYFCPASVASASVQRSINRIFDLERLSSLGQPTARPVLHWPKRTKDRALATLAARDRFNDEELAAATELNQLPKP